MRLSKITLSVSLAAAFAAGAVVAPLAQQMLPAAHADAAPELPRMIDLLALKHADLPRTANPLMNGQTFVSNEHASIGVQSGDAPKHIHEKSDEIQYIIEGSGSMWLGGVRQDFKPGTLIIIPKGTVHGGTIASAGPVKAIAIKLPPQAKGDAIVVP